MLFELQKNELQRKTVEKVVGIFFEFIFHTIQVSDLNT
jgi:hypothetical protein